jgi:hypothetical protein
MARGRPSNHRLPDEVRALALSIVRDRYADFGPSLAAEKLAEHHGCSVSREHKLRDGGHDDAVTGFEHQQNTRAGRLDRIDPDDFPRHLEEPRLGIGRKRVDKLAATHLEAGSRFEMRGPKRAFLPVAATAWRKRFRLQRGAPKVRFAPDSLLEQRGFEPLVPLLNELLSPTKTKRSHFESAIVAGTTEDLSHRGDVERIARTLSLTCCTATDLVISRTTAFEAIVRSVESRQPVGVAGRRTRRGR